MKKLLSLFALSFIMLASIGAHAGIAAYTVSPKDIFQGYITEKIWLSEYVLPDVVISGLTYTGNVALPVDAKAGDPAKILVALGMERKRPFVIVHIPAFMAGATSGIINQVSGFSLAVTEKPKPAARLAAAARASDITTSVLATGTWYKIAITKTGFYKIDYNFLNSMGVKPAGIAPANIRICGNGGNMLSKDNGVARPGDLLENYVLSNDNGDNVFDNGESLIFYAVGPTAWYKDSVNQRFVHSNNLYTDTAYYFISFNSGTGKRIAHQAALSGSNVNVTTYNYHNSHELDLVNPAGIGSIWYGETFSSQLGNTSQSVSFDIGAPVSNVYCSASFGSTSPVKGCAFTVTVNNNLVGSQYFPDSTGGNTDNDMNIGVVSGAAACNSQTASVTVKFSPTDLTSLGYLYYIELNARPSLSMTGDQMNFRDWQSVGAGNIANFQLQGANSSTQVWDVTNPQVPVVMSGSLGGSTYSFTQDASRLHEFAAMNSSNLYTPKYIAQVPNQNLHGLTAADLIIVTYPDFLDQANQLAAHHQSHDKMRVVVATTAQVYNEFSSGAQDLSAIRDFTKMFYDRATDSTDLPKYLLLFGGASYDYKNRLPGNSDFVPVFESLESSSDLDCYCTDDFFGFLDDSEFIENGRINTLDVGVGRLPARTKADASAVVSKIINYASPASLGPWRLSTTIVADEGCISPGNYDAAGNHMLDAEEMAAAVTQAGSNLYNQQKIYVDAIPLASTPAGARCPNANAALDEQVFNGTFLINYNGHGNPTVWSAERILTEDDFNNWNNLNALPLMVTATCDFGQFDHPQYISSAEQMVVEGVGGVIAVLTTTEAVYATFNAELNSQYLISQFTRNADKTWNTFGQASRAGKNATYLYTADPSTLINFRKFALLGDPALTPDFPQYNVVLDSFKDGFSSLRADTIKALGSYIVSGSVRDYDNKVMDNFNGTVYVSFYDKPRKVNTITGCNGVYQIQDNIVFKGRVSVINGLFSFTFIAPKDINYSYGTGKISAYANTDAIDAAGTDTLIAVGGFSDNPVLNTNPPVVMPYINDSLFRNDGITGNNTSLFVAIYSATGINVSGADIGHDLTGVLDGVADAPYILNDYYESAPNTYQRGYLNFPISGLANGQHSIKVTAWDVNNNRGEGTVDFIVVDSQVVDIQQLGNYPNPFNNTTHFVFEHNHPFDQLNVQIEIYNISGSLVKKIEQNNMTPGDSRTVDIEWDGTDNNNSRLPSGVYVYRLVISSDKGYKSSAYQKLVIVR